MTPGAQAGAAVIDWSRPWLAPYREMGEPVARAWRAGATVAEALNAAAAAIVGPGGVELPRFVGASTPASGEAYEAFIARTRSVPTRNNLHDFFNGLVWLHLPALKWAMNRMQAAEIARLGIGCQRGALRDALTLFDENGAVLDAPPPLIERLTARDWSGVFVTERARWRSARLLLVGHALLEKLVQPRKPITAHTLVAPGRACAVDRQLADALEHSARPFLPLPVLGVPGWWPANEASSFYDDASVFRPPSRKRRPVPTSLDARGGRAGRRPASEGAHSGRKPSTER